MSQSQTHRPAPSRRGPARGESVTTAAGIAAERVAFADRERERCAARGRSGDRRSDARPADPRR
jgi:hypothetical protein